MLNAIIVEDELYIRKGLISMLAKVTNIIHIVAECATVEQAVEAVKVYQPNLVFLDVELPDGNAFDFIKNTNLVTYKIIFITAYREYAFEALKNEAVDYLLKPIEESELKQAISKVEKQIKNEVSQKEYLVLRLQDSYQRIKFESILFCKSDKGYTTFYLDNGKKIIASKPLKEFVEQLPYFHFFRTHQSYVVNMNYAESYNKAGYIFLKTGDKIPVSKAKKEKLMGLFF